MPKAYTVVGFYEDNDQRSSHWIVAKGPNSAERKAIVLAREKGWDFVPVAVFNGRITAVDTKTYIKGGI